MAISRSDVERVALLARLDLSDAQLEALPPQLAGIVAYVDQLAEVDTDGVEQVGGDNSAQLRGCNRIRLEGHDAPGFPRRMCRHRKLAKVRPHVEYDAVLRNEGQDALVQLALMLNLLAEEHSPEPPSSLDGHLLR